MSNYKVEFTLKQHTPIIHFQSDQNGATLRATELKPKLDRFIVNKLKNIRNDIYVKYQEIIENELIFPKDGKGSNCYKLSLFNYSKSTISIPKAYVNQKKETNKAVYQSPYFADAYKSIQTTTSIKVIIHSFNKELLKLLNEVKDYIFVYENFGTRQSKGFGSFLRADITKDEITTILKSHQNPYFLLNSYKDFTDAFLKIDTFYKKLKMGINDPYEKSILFKFMCNEYKIGWEKKFIKNNFPQVIHGDHKPLICENSNDKEFRYIRAVLGLAEHNEFRPDEGKKQIKIKSVDGIERFKSPITFKIFNDVIYILFDNSYKELLNKEFSFTLDKNSKNLKTPEKFDMYKFLKFVENQEKLIKEVL